VGGGSQRLGKEAKESLVGMSGMDQEYSLKDHAHKTGK